MDATATSECAAKHPGYLGLAVGAERLATGSGGPGAGGGAVQQEGRSGPTAGSQWQRRGFRGTLEVGRAASACESAVGTADKRDA